MKKVLLGTTALMAGGLIAGSATAADIVPAPIPEPIEEGFTLSINGDALAAFSFRSTDECDDFAANVAAFGPVTGFSLLLGAAAGGGQALANAAALATTNTNFNTTTTTITGAGVINQVGTTTTTFGFSGVTKDFGPCDAGGNVFHDDEPTHVYWDSGLDVTAEITLANGLNVAVYLEADWFDDVNVGDYWIALSGHWGTFEIGNVDGAYKQSLVWVPGAGGIATVDGGDARPHLGMDNFPDGPLDEPNRGLQLNYFTPRLAGFQFGVSYSPDSDGVDQSDGNAHVLDSDDEYIHAWQVGLNWEHEFANGWALAIGGGFGHASAETTHDTFTECNTAATGAFSGGNAQNDFGLLTGDYDCGDVDTWGIGGEFSGNVLTIGGGYSHRESDFGRERFAAAIEGVVTVGPWQAGLGYAHEGDDHAYGGFTDRANVVAAGLAKDIAPGVQVGGFLYWIETREAYHSAIPGPLGAVDSFAIGTSIVTRW